MRKFFMAAVTIAGFAALAALPGAADAGGFRGGPPGPPPVPPAVAEKYDIDHDGMLSPSEDKAARDAFLEQYDADSDGRLSCREMRKAGEDMRRDLFEKLDADNDEVLSWEEFSEPMEVGAGGFAPVPLPQEGQVLDNGQRSSD